MVIVDLFMLLRVKMKGKGKEGRESCKLKAKSFKGVLKQFYLILSIVSKLAPVTCGERDLLAAYSL